METFQNTLSFLLINVRVIGYIVQNCKGSTFICALKMSTCFYKIKKKAISVLSRRLHEKPKCSEYLPHWLDKYRKLWITTLKWHNLNRKQLFHYKIPKDAFLSKCASNEESQDHHQMHGWSKIQLFQKHWELLVTPHAPNFSLMLCMVNCHLYANACEFALRIGQAMCSLIFII